MKRIMLVDDHEMIRDAIKLYFLNNEEYSVNAEASDGVEALDLLRENEYDLVLSDINMPNMNGIEFSKEVRSMYPDNPILILTMFDDITHVKKLIEIGVNGFVLKNANKNILLEAVDKVMNGGEYYSKEVYEILISNISKRKAVQRITYEEPLSNREKEILQLIAKEYSNQEIADKLFISIRTVETHKGNLLGKTGCKNVAGLVMFAVEKGIV